MHRIDHNTGLLNPSDQRDHRRFERLVRKSAVAFARWGTGLGMHRRQIADLLGLRSRTLGRWISDWNQERLPLLARGRPRRFTSDHQRALAVELLDHSGPRMGLPGLREAFPHITRSELIQIRAAVREQHASQNAREHQFLKWPHPGSVWAFDFTQPPVPVEDRYNQILAGRDLASGFQLLALPVVHATADVVISALDLLFRQFGPPLVFKSDNGSPFIADVTAQLLRQWRVTHLPSPPLTPRYNGSIEAGIGSLKTHAHHRAVHHGRIDHWNADDLEAARMDANFSARPWGNLGPSPLQKWESRTPITTSARDLFIHTVESESRQARIDMGLPETGSLNRVAQADVARASVRRALETLGYLLSTRRLLSPSFKY